MNRKKKEQQKSRLHSYAKQYFLIQFWYYCASEILPNRTVHRVSWFSQVGTIGPGHRGSAVATGARIGRCEHMCVAALLYASVNAPAYFSFLFSPPFPVLFALVNLPFRHQNVIHSTGRAKTRCVTQKADKEHVRTRERVKQNWDASRIQLFRPCVPTNRTPTRGRADVHTQSRRASRCTTRRASLIGNHDFCALRDPIRFGGCAAAAAGRVWLVFWK